MDDLYSKGRLGLFFAYDLDWKDGMAVCRGFIGAGSRKERTKARASILKEGKAPLLFSSIRSRLHVSISDFGKLSKCFANFWLGLGGTCYPEYRPLVTADSPLFSPLLQSFTHPAYEI